MRAQDGDTVAVGLIFDRFADPLFRYLAAKCQDAVLAEDVSGDTWLRVVERLHKFRIPDTKPEAAFASWLYRIAYNLMIDTQRRHGSHPGPLADDLAAPEMSAEDRLIRAETGQALQVALAQLPAPQRDIILLRFVADRSSAEVASLTGQTEGAVRVMQHRALRALARLLHVGSGEQDDG